MKRKVGIRYYASVRDVTLKLLTSTQTAIIKQRRKAFRLVETKQRERAEAAVRSKGDQRLQDRFTAKQLKRRQKQIKRNIAKRKRFKYQRQGGDIALGRAVTKETKANPQKWQTNFYSSNVWKFKMRGGNLMIAFLDGSIYIYWGAGRLFLGLFRAGSKGKFVWRNLRRKGISYSKIK